MKYSILLFVGIITFIFPNTTLACGGFVCPTDLSILGQATAIQDNVVTIRPFHTFATSKHKVNEEIKINDPKHEFETGKKYFLYLYQKEPGVYVTVFRAQEITGDSYENAKLITMENGDDAYLQLWMNNNGKDPEVHFYGMNNGFYARISNPDSPFYRDLQIFPDPFLGSTNQQIPLYLAASFLAGAGGTYLLTRKK